MKEKFRPVKDFPAYRVSNLGRLQSRWRGNWAGIGTRGGKYLSVALCRCGEKPSTRRIHRLVAEAFLKRPKGLVCVRHKDGNAKNNRVENLAWGTYLENEHDKKRHGKWYTRISNATLTPKLVREIRARVASGEKQRSLAIGLGVSRPTITRVVNLTIWRHVK